MKPQRSLSQNASMHKYFEEVAQLLNESGISVPLLLEEFEIDFSKEMVKRIWQKIAFEKFGKDGTSKLSTDEVDKVYEEFNRGISKHGLHMPFPSRQAQHMEEYYNNIIN